VALVGDACHAFPPDIGQGVNAGLCDVVSLDRALKGLNTETGKMVASSDGKRTASLQKNLERYQQQHAPENAALIRLARFGAPYQYKQPHRADRVLLKLWTLNVAVRLILSKLTFGLVPPSSIILSQNEKLTYRQVMRRADLTTAVFKTIFLGVFGLLVKQRFGFGFLEALFA
jgi:2-polyprenyl-6-methoxyphenol hydroxylase-like FAD-dependent oxidoreductase